MMTPENLDAPTSDVENAELDRWLAQAWKHVANQEYAQAESLFRRAQKAYPQAYQAAYGLGLSLKMTNRPQEAIQSFQQALDLLEKQEVTDDATRRTMLRRLVSAHLSMLAEK